MNEIDKLYETMEIARKYKLLRGCFEDLAEAFHSVGHAINKDTHMEGSFKNCVNAVCSKCVEVLEEAKI